MTYPAALRPRPHSDSDWSKVGNLINSLKARVIGGEGYYVVPTDAPALYAGELLAAGLAALGPEGGVIDARGLVGTQTIAVDIFAGFLVEKPVLFLFGPATFVLSVQQNVPSKITFCLHGTRFKLDDGQTQSRMFSLRTGSGAVTCTSGTATITFNAAPSNGALLEPGKTIGLFGHAPTGATDRTTISVDPGAGGTTIDVASTAAFPATNGYLRIENEVVFYTGTTATSFTGCTRGYGGTTAAAHGIGVNVDRAVYETYRVRSVSGLVATVERNVVVTATAMDAHVGVTDVTFDGVGWLDGDKPASDTSANGVGIYGFFANRLYVGTGIRLEHWDHIGVQTVQGRDCDVFARCSDIGWPSLQLGAAVSFFQGSQDCRAEIVTENCNISGTVDSRTSGGDLYDNRCNGNTVIVIRNRGGWRPIVHEEGDHCTLIVWSSIGHSGAAIRMGSPQWGTPNGGIENTLIVGSVSPQNPIVSHDANMVDKRNALISMIRAGTHALVEGNTFGNQLLIPPTFFSLTYSASITPDAGRGKNQLITVTDANAFTINNPNNPQHGLELKLFFFNNSGGAMATPTFGSQFRLEGAFVPPANGNWRWIEFTRQTANKWREAGRSVADSPN